jgi:hypothetical protein
LQDPRLAASLARAVAEDGLPMDVARTIWSEAGRWSEATA